jgi:hypothetical protein
MWTFSNMNRNKHVQRSSLTNEYLEQTWKCPLSIWQLNTTFLLSKREVISRISFELWLGKTKTFSSAEHTFRVSMIHN